MQSIAHFLMTSRPRETGGARAGESRTFQVQAAICAILDSHEVGDDYVVALESYDDFVVFKLNKEPPQACFVQVKTSEAGFLSLAEMMWASKDGNYPKSVFGKMLYNIYNMDSKSDFLPICELRADCIFRDGSITLPDNFRLYDLDDDKYFNLLDSLSDDLFPNIITDKDLKSTYLRPLHFNASNAHLVIMGRLVEILESQYGVQDPPVKAIYSSLLADAIKKDNHKRDYDQLDPYLERKAISRSQIEKIFSIARKNAAAPKLKQLLKDDMLRGGYNVLKIAEASAMVDRYLVDRMRGERSLVTLSEAAARALDTFSGRDLQEFPDFVVSLGLLTAPLDDYRKIALMLEAMEISYERARTEPDPADLEHEQT